MIFFSVSAVKFVVNLILDSLFMRFCYAVCHKFINLGCGIKLILYWFGLKIEIKIENQYFNFFEILNELFGFEKFNGKFRFELLLNIHWHSNWFSKLLNSYETYFLKLQKIHTQISRQPEK